MKIRSSSTLVVLAAGALLGAVAVSGGLSRPAQAAPQDREEIITFEVRLPAGAILEIDGNKTTSTGELRRFETPPLRVGKNHTYTLKAMANGKEVTRKIELAHGKENRFDLRPDFRAGATSREAARIGEEGPQESTLPLGQAKGKRALEFIAAFDKGDARAVADFWMPDATYVDQQGREYKGRAAIQKLYEKTFADNKGSKLAIFVTSAKLLSPDIALEDGVTEVTPADGSPSSSAHFSAVIVKKDGEWHFQSVHETLASPPSNAAHFDDIDWLIGSWTTDADKSTGQALTASYAWADNKNFIVSTFAATLRDVPVTGGTQWIAWDAVEKRIRSWTFYSAGGFGEAVWTQDGDRWLVATKAHTADGKKVSATNVITKIDKDHATWQMTKLTVDGKEMPDPSPTKVKRVKTEKP
jgi:uncharacterized protein (TIGR02246 family)